MTEYTTGKESGSDARSTSSLLTEAATRLTGLFRKEIDLGRAELSESAHRAAVAVGLILGGVVFVLVALNVLSAALVAGLTELGMEAGWAALLVGAVYLVIAVTLVRKGAADLKSTDFAPTRTIESVRRDAHALKETFNGQR